MGRLVLLVTVWLLGFCPAITEAGHETKDVTTITAERVKFLVDAGEKLLLVDLRPAKEFQQKRVPGSCSIPMTELDKRLGEIPKAGMVIVYSATPQNEIMDAVFQYFEDNGYKNIAVMVEGFQGWVRRKYPVETGRK